MNNVGLIDGVLVDLIGFELLDATLVKLQIRQSIVEMLP